MNKTPIMYKMSKLTKNKYVFLLGLLLIAFTFFFVYKTINQSADKSKTNELLHFKSTRVPLSFDYPKDFPVISAGSEYEGGYLNNETLEHVEFSDTFKPNARSDTYGYIIVKNSDVEDLYNFLTEKYSSSPSVSISIHEYQIDKIQGYEVDVIPDSSNGGYLSPVAKQTFYFYKDGLLYEMALTNPTYQNSNPDNTNNIFINVILQSLKLE